MKQYALNLLIGLDQFANVILGGAPTEQSAIEYMTTVTIGQAGCR